jgi:hypothetical protein
MFSQILLYLLLNALNILGGMLKKITFEPLQNIVAYIALVAVDNLMVDMSHNYSRYLFYFLGLISIVFRD